MIDVIPETMIDPEATAAVAAAAPQLTVEQKLDRLEAAVQFMLASLKSFAAFTQVCGPRVEAVEKAVWALTKGAVANGGKRA